MSEPKRKKRKGGPFWGARLRCLNCQDVVQSAHQHDFAACSCFKKDEGTGVAIDGGGVYCRMITASRFEILDPGNYEWPS